jgi:two-component system OmpR family sensor kinase
MRLASKTTLITAIVTLLATLSASAMVLLTTYNTGIQQVQNRLDLVSIEVGNSDEDKVSSALVVVATQEISLTFEEADGTQTVLQEVPQTGNADPVVSKSLDLGNDEKLIFKTAINDLQSNAWSSVFLSLLLGILAAAIATLLSRWLLARDLAHIHTLTRAAHSISKGEEADLRGAGTSIEIAELSRALETMVQRLQKSKDEMQDFLSDASHELRTPLTVIRGYLELLQADQQSSQEKVQGAVSRAHREALRMQTLINDILTLAELGQLPAIEIVEVNLTQLIQDRIIDSRNLEPKREIKFICTDSVKVKGSPELLTQLITNIFGNIRSHTPTDSEVRVEVKATYEFVTIQVDDSGPGLKDLVSGQVLTEFRRFDATRSRVSGGSGLGLSIMARIVELHQGKLEVGKSSLGGLRVSVKFPTGS